MAQSILKLPATRAAASCRRLPWPVLLPVIVILIAAANTLPAQTTTDAAGTPATKSSGNSLTELSERFTKVMRRVRRSMDRRQDARLDITPQLERIVSDGADGRRDGFPEVIAILRQRIIVERTLVSNLETAQDLYGRLGEATSAEQERLKGLNQLKERDLVGMRDNLVAQTERLSKVLDEEGKVQLIKHYADVKTEFLADMVDKLQDEQLPTLDRYFERWREMVRTRLLADQYQLLNFAHYAQAFEWIDGRNAALEAISDIDAGDYLSDMGQADLNSVNLSSVLNATFAKLVADAYELPTTAETVVPENGFRVSITPNHGLGGVYYYSDSGVGLRDAAYVHAHGHQPFYGERISFTLLASQDCSFILRYVDAVGNVLQICPNRYAPDLNRLEANVPTVIPPSDMAFEFAASGPPGIETVRLIVTPDAGFIDVDRDPEISLDDVVAEELQMRTDTGELRLQSLTTPQHAASYNTAIFDGNVTGNAIMVEAFVRILPLPRNSQ